MANAPDRPARRSFLEGLVLLPALAATLGGIAAADSSKATKSAMHYQSKIRRYVPSGRRRDLAERLLHGVLGKVSFRVS
jgi:hypothetical protein